LVTGASAGIGAELARELAARGYNLVLVARRAERLQALADELRLSTGVHADVEACDLADSGARQALVGRLQGGERAVAGVCNNAGFGSVGHFSRQPLDREQEMIRLNVEALHHLTGAWVPRMVERGVGAILNVGSTSAYQPLPGMATYAATKAFVQSFSESVHSELAGTGVSVTCLSPGFTRTDFAAEAGAGSVEAVAPGFLTMDARDVARAGVDGMVAGRRTVVPGIHNKASTLGGRLVPRTLLLPIARRVAADRLDDRRG
jgi:short-subunit dehydrogenase